MSEFIWSEKYSVDVELIDQQHYLFFKLCNEIGAYVENKHTDSVLLLELVSQLGDYAMYHLNTEEEYFATFGCPDMEDHIAAHTKFRIQVKDFIDRARHPQVDVGAVSLEVSEFVTNWLAEHIMVMDKGYTTCFHEHGLK